VVEAPPSGEEARFVRIDTVLAGWPFRALAGEVWFPMTFCAFRYEVRNALPLG
jgi:hypothetical protein